MYNADLSVLLMEFTIPVDYRIPTEYSGMPAAPFLSVTTDGADVTLSWTVAPSADGYTLVFAPSPGAPYIASLDMGTETSATLTIYAGSPEYYYAVFGYNVNGMGDLSNIVVFPPAP